MSTASPSANEPVLAVRRTPENDLGNVINLHPKRILVLGATSGIAEACIRILAERGENLYLVARNADRLAAVAADARTRGANYVDFAVADLDQTAIHPDLLAHAINSLAGLDIAYLALGVLGEQPKAERTFEEAGKILGTYFLQANQRGGGAHVANCGYITAEPAGGRGIARAMCSHSLEWARARGPAKRDLESMFAGAAAKTPNLASRSGCWGQWRMGPRISRQRLLHSSTRGRRTRV